MKNPVIFQVVGYQNSGKTTVMTKLIEKFNREHLKVAAIKHHGHGGKPDIIEQKDSSKHLNAGATVSIVEGEGDLLLHSVRSSWTLMEKIQLLHFFKPDIILIEGHKKAEFPKILLLREKNDLKLISQLNHIKAIIVKNEQLVGDVATLTNVPIFLLQEESYADWANIFIRNQKNEVVHRIIESN